MVISGDICLEDVACPLNCPGEDEFVLTGCDMLHGSPGEFSVLKCRSCGLMRTSPRPTSDTIVSYYPPDYGPYVGTRIEQQSSSWFSGIKNLVRPLAMRVFDSKTEALPPMRPGRLLEIGCASGSFLHKMAGRGWQVEGVEFSKQPAEAAGRLGYKVYAGQMETAPEPVNPVDLIVGWMVLEHLMDPVGSLKKMNEWASPDAWLVLSVPNAGSIEFEIFKDKWYALQLPTHCYHFTPESLTKVLRLGGWELENIHHQRSVTNLLVSLAYVMESKGWKRLGKRLRDFAFAGGICFYLLFPVAWVLAVFGQTGRMTVWARKRVDTSGPSLHTGSGSSGGKIEE